MAMLVRGVRPTRLHAARLCSSKPKPPPGPANPQFGKQVAAEASAAQGMHEIGKGRWEYIGGFMQSMNRGPVKLEFGEGKPLSAKQIEQDEKAAAALKMIQRSMLTGTLLAAGGTALGWVLTKWYMGVKNVNEFSEAMKQKMPKVSGEMEDSMIGRKLKEQSETSRDTISEDPTLTDWRRSLRSKFNTEEGARIARANSIVLAEQRQKERFERKKTKKVSGAPPPTTTAAAAAEALSEAETAELTEALVLAEALLFAEQAAAAGMAAGEQAAR